MVEVIRANDSACVALAESAKGLKDGNVECITGNDLSEFDYFSVGKSGFVPVNVKPVVVNRLDNMSVRNE
jgi:hypothetical protein